MNTSNQAVAQSMPLLELELLRTLVAIAETGNFSAAAAVYRRLHTRTGRPLGNEQFMNFIEEQTGRDLKPGKPGPKPAD